MSRAVIELRDAAGRRVLLVLSVFSEYVECTIGNRCYAVFDRDALRIWLANPTGMLSCDGMTWADTEHDDIAVTLDGLVPLWPVADLDLVELRRIL